MPESTVGEIISQYMTSPDCARSEVNHYGILLAGLGRYTGNFIDVLKPRDWTHWRWEVAQGGWRVGDSISSGWGMRYINEQMRRILKAMRWAALNELIEMQTYERFRLIKPLRPGQISAARESLPTQAVDWQHVEAVRPHCSSLLWDMIRVHWYTGMRSNELVRINMKEMTFEPNGDIWLYSPIRHKTQHLGKQKTIVIGPQAIAILKNYLFGHGPQGYLFTNRRGKILSSAAYGMQINRAVRKAMCPYWHAHQLRHARAQHVDRTMGREAAAALLGDSIQVASIYTRRNIDLAIRAARSCG